MSLSFSQFTSLGISVLLFIAFLPTIHAQGMELDIAPLYFNANQCGMIDLSITNTGDQDLFHVRAPPTFNIPNCCSFTSSKNIEVLEAGTTQTIPLRVCAPPSTEKGEYAHQLPVTAFDREGTVPFHISVTKNFEEGLVDRITFLEFSLERFLRQGLSVSQVGHFLAVQAGITEARTHLGNGDTEETRLVLERASTSLDSLEAARGGLSFSFVVFPGILILIFLIGLFVITRVERKPFVPDKPTLIPTMEKGKPSLVRSIDLLEVKLSLLAKDKLQKTDRDYYQKAQTALQDARNYIVNNSLEKAKKAFNEAEINLKVLEHRLVSFNLLQRVGELARSI